MISKNKKLFLKIYIPFVIIISIALIILQILGSKNRIGYLTDFKLNVYKTLELNNLENINNELDEEGLKNFILNNENITNYIYHFRIRYYDKTFRNNDIYGVYPDLSNLPDYMKNTEMDGDGSPYGNFISDRREIEEKIDNINYVLKIKYDIICITLIFSLFFFIFYLFCEKKNIKIENIFLVSFILIGLAYFILLPFTQAPDEVNHFIRAYEIANGYLISDKNQSNYGGRLLPEELQNINRIQSYKELIQNIKNNKELSGEKTFILFPNTALYFFVSYIPQSIGIFIGKLFTHNFTILAYFGRLFNFVFFVLIFYLSIKYTPIKKISLYLIAFLPMTLQEAASLAADPIIISCSALLISICLNIKYREENNFITLKEIILIYLLMLFIAGSKIIYLPICFIILIIPKEKFKNNKLFVIAPILIISILINIVWMGISLSYSNGKYIDTINEKEQVHFILNNMFGYFFIFINTIIKYYKFYITSIIGQNLSWFNIHIPNIAYYIFLLSTILLFLFDNNIKSKEISVKIKCIIFIIISLTIGLMFSALYVSWTPVGDNIIEGVQGRYFLPILFYIFIFFSNNKLKINFEYIRIHIFIILSMSNLLVLNKIFSSFFTK